MLLNMMHLKRRRSVVVPYYGFDFDGATYIKSNNYITINPTSMSKFFKVKFNTETGMFGYNTLIAGDVRSTPDNTADIYVRIGSSNGSYEDCLYVRYADMSTMVNIQSQPLIVGNTYACCITTYLDGVDLYMSLVIDGDLVDTVFIKSNSIYTSAHSPKSISKADFGSDSNGSLITCCVSDLSDYAIYTESLSISEMILLTTGGFDNTDPRIGYYRSFNETVGSDIVTGTEQYALMV